MKQTDKTTQSAWSYQNAGLDYLNDFEAWLGYEFWSSQIEADAEEELFDSGTEEFTSHRVVMEIRNPYQITRIADVQKVRVNDALPF